MNPIKILLVEDDEFIRDIFHEILQSSGYAVTTAVDGGEAFDQITKGVWDLVLLDVMMPKMTGTQVMEKIHNEKLATNYKKLIFLTNVDEGKDLETIKALGNGYFIKSELTPPLLVEKIKELFPA